MRQVDARIRMTSADNSSLESMNENIEGIRYSQSNLLWLFSAIEMHSPPENILKNEMCSL